ncbi:MAG: hypothetical protein AAB468_00575 [Patescibacteria group bacterium]
MDNEGEKKEIDWGQESVNALNRSQTSKTEKAKEIAEVQLKAYKHIDDVVKHFGPPDREFFNSLTLITGVIPLLFALLFFANADPGEEWVGGLLIFVGIYGWWWSIK